MSERFYVCLVHFQTILASVSVALQGAFQLSPVFKFIIGLQLSFVTRTLLKLSFVLFFRKNVAKVLAASVLCDLLPFFSLF